MTRATITTAQLAKRLQQMQGELESAAIRGLRSAARRAQGYVVTEIEAVDAVDTGELKRSTKVTNTDKGALLHVDAPHAPYIEHGTRPHWPPLGPLADWARRKGLADDDEEAEEIAYAIAAQISRWGTPARQYFQKALAALERDDIVNEELDRELRLLASR